MKSVSEMTVAELKRELKKRKQRVGGGERTLRSRLQQVILEEQEGLESRPSNGESTSLLEIVNDRFDKITSELASTNAEMTKSISNLCTTMESTFDYFKNSVKTMQDELNVTERKMNDRMNKMEKRVSDIFEFVSGKNADCSLINISRTTQSPVYIKPPKFNGKSSWPTFKTQFDRVASRNQWNNDDRLTHLMLALQDDAELLLQSFSVDGTYENLVDMLEARYGESHLKPLYRSQFANRRRESNESIQEFASDLERLIRQAYGAIPSDVQNSLLINSFVAGLGNTEMAATVTTAGKTNYWEAVAVALAYETARKSIGPAMKIREATIEDDTGTSVEAIKARRPRNITCYHCTRKGHIRRECPEFVQLMTKKESPQEN